MTRLRRLVAVSAFLGLAIWVSSSLEGQSGRKPLGAAATPQHFLEHREQIEDTGGNVADAVLPNSDTNAEIFFHGEVRKNFAALGNVTDADPGARLGDAPPLVRRIACNCPGRARPIRDRDRS